MQKDVPFYHQVEDVCKSEQIRGRRKRIKVVKNRSAWKPIEKSEPSKIKEIRPFK